MNRFGSSLLQDSCVDFPGTFSVFRTVRDFVRFVAVT